MACSKVRVDDNNNEQPARHYFKIDIIESNKVKSSIKNVDLSMSVADVYTEMSGNEDEIMLIRQVFVENRTEIDKTITFGVLKDFGFVFFRAFCSDN
ncbi:hypothetical protein DPMN_023830 [Dreissena polymorpha]|uniref:Uncharacterized protein n=1 Tax=Dreissena polymorpha TaxID=45954 RepID=A0A9D4LD46_DREPO|nr:hypothetical protein DPMN_148358 [Dreissena polymorpha]KAH3856340.1 hypothetical protein DPMN_098926 [Dreissena polymorpha]KAH3860907.1 hypothetical protein DPMN_023830 [Dreissena polymorpha]